VHQGIGGARGLLTDVARDYLTWWGRDISDEQLALHFWAEATDDEG
jgi:hypothetical protein